MPTPTSQDVPLPARIELLSNGFKRSLILSLRPIAGGVELTATVWVSGHALARASAYIAGDKGLRLRHVPDSLQEDFGDVSLTLGRTDFALQTGEVDRLRAFLDGHGVMVES